jgi:glucose/arabinose dehydrogenase
MLIGMRSFAVGLGAMMVLVMGSTAGQAAPCSAGLLSGAAALDSDWRDDRPGLCRQILPADLGPPSKSNISPAKVVPRPHSVRKQLPTVPPGFSVRAFRVGVAQPRLIRAAPNGDIFVADSRMGRIRILRPAGSCTLGGIFEFATDLDLPFGIAFYPPGPSPQYVYVAENSRVVRYPYVNGMVAATGAPEVVVPDLPQGAGSLRGKGHWTRDLVFSPDGTTMYVSVGSYSNAQTGGEDETDRAAVLAFDPDGANRRVFATGLRNPVSMSFSPHNGWLWVTNNERDKLGDHLVPDFVTPIGPGQFYGWPWFYIGENLDPRHAASYPVDHPPVSVPSVLLQAHSSSLGSAFYTGTQFPAEYQGSLFVATHGSWNTARPTGSKVIRILFDAAGNALPYYEDFMTGFVVANHDVWGRPVGIAVGVDGSLYVSEDANRTIWCVSYTGTAP